ncbi:acyltransferase family protein [Microbulbifer sp. SA54]|uniref:acyltransferase family protein n=1 Tax=Microbulbifer sp. SA54 TaxID=3401577 RepID=UPI003AAE1B41
MKEIQGVRAVAALLVAVYHIWFQKVSGGVDAFFVISGFFVFRTFSKYEAVSWDIIFSYYRKTFSRIVPSASIVILFTCLGYLMIGMESKWSDQVRSAIAAIFFVENWWLAMSSVDYLAQGGIPSPFQQMWALSVQMQIYISMPVLLFMISAISVKYKLRRSSVFAILVFLFLVSFLYALVVTYLDQPRAYFDTGARLWEFLIGAMLAARFSEIRFSRFFAAVLGYSCLFIFMIFAAVIPVSEYFPGVAALIPVLATVGIILASSNSAGIWLLNNAVMQKAGNLSFTFYLWHWPLLTAYWQLSGNGDVGVVPGLAIIFLSGVFAYLTYAFVEKPFRKSSLANGKFLPAMAACCAVMVPAFVMVGVWGGQYVSVKERAEEDVRLFWRGKSTADLVPASVIAKSDVPQAYRNGCNQRWGNSELIECVFGNKNGEKSVVLVGGSHSLHWLPTLQEIAKIDQSIKITTMTKGNCPLTLSGESLGLPENDVCIEWSKKAISRINELRPEAVFTLLTSSRDDAGLEGDYIPVGFYEAWKGIPDLPIIAVRDTPRAEFDFVLCVDRFGPTSDQCSVDKRKKLDPEITAMIQSNHIAKLGLPKNVHPIDLTDLVCEGESCNAVANGVLKFRDRTHLTATYARVLAPALYERIKKSGVLLEKSLRAPVYLTENQHGTF